MNNEPMTNLPVRRRFLQDKRGFSVTWRSVFCAFVLVPPVVLSIGAGRYATAEVQEAADLAALATSRDILVRLYENEGYVQFADQVPYRRARQYANSNTHYLDRYDIEVEIVDILIDEAGDTITVRVSADLTPLVPEFGLSLDHTVVCEGEAQVRASVDAVEAP
jgi:hypothetical protein